MQNAKKSSEIRHLSTIAQLLRAISSQLRHASTIGTAISPQCVLTICSMCPHNMVNFGPLTAKIGCRVWGTPANFNGFHSRPRLVTARTSLNGGQPNFARCLAFSWAGTLCIHFYGSCPITEFCQVQKKFNGTEV